MIPGFGNAAETISVAVGALGLQGQAPNPNDLNEYINPPTDPRLNSILSKMNSPLKRGIIQQTDDWVRSPQRYPYACRFMFNPATINVGYQVDTGALPPGQLTMDQLAGVANYPGATSIGFSLLFDRTYEVAYGPTQTNKRDMRKIGVYRDIMALEAIVGVRNLFSPTKNGEAFLGNMAMVPVYVIFGGGNGGNASKPTTGLSFVGSLTQMSVTYTLFSQSMVPTRAAVDFTLAQIIGRGANDYQKGGGTVIDRAHAPGRNTTASGANVRTPTPVPRGRSVAQ